MSPAPRPALPERPDLDQLKRQAKELLEAFPPASPDATAEVHAHYRGADPATFALHDAQLVLARAYGFESWPKLKAFVEGDDRRRLVDAIRARDTATVQQLLARRPELVRMSNDNLHVLHYAVLADAPDVVRLLMAHGANAREGVYPYREATTAHALAVQRGTMRSSGSSSRTEQKQRTRRAERRTHPRPRSVPGDCGREHRSCDRAHER